MSTSFAALMAIGDANSRASQAAVKEALEARKKREAEQRRAREEKEAKEREREKQLHLKRMEEERREKERKEKMEAEMKRKEEAGRLKEKEKMHAMLFGKKAAARMVGSKSGSSSSKPSGSSSAKKDNGLDDDDDGPPGLMLTREELRARKTEMALKRQFQMSKRPTASSGFSKRGNRLPGGAVNVTLNEEGAAAMLNDNSGGSIKDRLSKMPNYLTKLNTVKRDRRTEDEIQMAIRERKAKVLEGDDAKGFDAWFSSPGKKKDVPKKSATPEFVPAASSSSKTATSTSRPTNASTPFIVTKPKIPVSIPASTPASIPASIPSSRALSTKPPYGSSSTYASHKSSANPSRASSSEKQLTTSSSKLPKINKNSASSSSHRPTSTLATSKPKRPRSPSLSDSPPPKRRHAYHDDDYSDQEGNPSAISNEIWSLFGKKRDEYTSRNVYSDDEDMEADATALEREEMRSARIAKKEDLAALAEERRHEEEKRRRKKEKDRATARGY